MQKYSVTGMSCAACSARVEKAVSGVEGVTSCSVNLLTNSMSVEGTADESQIISAVEKAGYGAHPENGKKSDKTDESLLSDKETPKTVKRLISSIVFLLILMYFSMGHSMLGLPLPSFFSDNHVAMGITQMLLAIIIMVINQRFFISGFKALIKRSPNMDTLVALGSSAAFIYSLVQLFLMTGAQITGGVDAAAEYMHEFYFESSAMILTLITVGKMLEARSKGKTTDAIKSLMELAPDTATVIRGGEEITVSVDSVLKDEIFVIRPGEKIAFDGVVIEGESAVNESAVTGESLPVDKTEGSSVTSGTLNLSGFLKCRVLRTGEDTTLSQIINLVRDASSTKAPIAKIADKVSGIFVPIVITIALITTIIWLFIRSDVGFALARGISVLVISCPCALGLATPVAVMVGSGLGAKNGILFKTAEAIENTGKASIVVLDKTGTVTKGEPSVTDNIPSPSHTEEKLLSLAYALESKSEHPLASAVIRYCSDAGINQTADLSDFISVTGKGLKGTIGNKTLVGGNLSFIREYCVVDDETVSVSDKLSEAGKTCLFFSFDGEYSGLIAVADAVKEDSFQGVKELKNLGFRVVMLTGDNKKTADAIASTVGIDEVIAQVKPDQKASVVSSFKNQGKVIMVGDGINDAPALTTADIGIAIGAGTDVAIDSADIVLMSGSLTDVSAAVRLSRQVMKNIKENLFWAFIYNIIGIPVAAGVFIPLGLTLNPMFGALAMSLSSFFVVSNALRLNIFKVHNTKNDKPVKIKKYNNNNTNNGGSVMKVIKIEGMMCSHCENNVKTALESIDGVKSAIADKDAKTATVELDKDIDNSVLIKAVEDKGYKVLGVE